MISCERFTELFPQNDSEMSFVPERDGRPCLNILREALIWLTRGKNVLPKLIIMFSLKMETFHKYL